MEPLANRMRPVSIQDIVGQEHILGENGLINKLIKKKQIISMIFYGNPGTGKTSLAKAIAHDLKKDYVLFSAVSGNKKELDEIFSRAKTERGLIVIVDEIHRLNRDKQDLLLPHVEDGTIHIIGITTSNPLFSINPAIRSRCVIVEIKDSTKEDIKKVLQKAILDSRGLNGKIEFQEAAIDRMAELSNGDVRSSLNLLEMVQTLSVDGEVVTDEEVNYAASFLKAGLRTDFEETKSDLMSAFQKSIRGSDVDAALFYLGQLLNFGDYDAMERRLLVTAYEDIGLANPAAASRTVLACQAARIVGMPEARLILATVVSELALSAKSKSAHDAINRVYTDVTERPVTVPAYLKLHAMQNMGEYIYPSERPDLWPKMCYLPEILKSKKYFIPNKNDIYYEEYEQLIKEERINNLESLIEPTKIETTDEEW